MNKNMRKMFTEEQITKLGGTKLYKHRISISAEINGDTENFTIVMINSKETFNDNDIDSSILIDGGDNANYGHVLQLNFNNDYIICISSSETISYLSVDDWINFQVTTTPY